MGAILTKLLGWGSTVLTGGLSFLAGIKTFLIVGAVCTVVSGAAGWYVGSSHEARIFAVQMTKAEDQAREAQQKQDDADYNKARLDFQRRAAADKVSNDKLRELLAAKPKVVVVHTPGKPDTQAISVESMKALNDPALIGDTSSVSGDVQ